MLLASVNAPAHEYQSGAVCRVGYFAKLTRKHGKGKALTVLAHKLARAVYHLLTRQQAFELRRFLPA